jgi:hypothetical protein
VLRAVQRGLSADVISPTSELQPKTSVSTVSLEGIDSTSAVVGESNLTEAAQQSLQIIQSFLGQQDGAREGDPYYVCELYNEVAEYLFFQDRFPEALVYFQKTKDFLDKYLSATGTGQLNDNSIREFSVEKSRLHSCIVACRSLVNGSSSDVKSRRSGIDDEDVIFRAEQLRICGEYDQLVRLVQSDNQQWLTYLLANSTSSSHMTRREFPSHLLPWTYRVNLANSHQPFGNRLIVCNAILQAIMLCSSAAKLFTAPDYTALLHRLILHPGVAPTATSSTSAASHVEFLLNSLQEVLDSMPSITDNTSLSSWRQAILTLVTSTATAVYTLSLSDKTSGGRISNVSPHDSHHMCNMWHTLTRHRKCTCTLLLFVYIVSYLSYC